MTVLLAIAIGGYPLFAFLFLRHLASVQDGLRADHAQHRHALTSLLSEHREEIGRRDGAHRDEIRQLHLSHREEIAALNQARMEETADLLQRIQAPEAAVAQHAGDNSTPDPPPVHLENDDEMFRLYEERLQGLVSG